MSQVNVTGLFGKLPAHGDFIYRDLPTHFINIWDEWLQLYVFNSQQQLGEHWLDIFLTSPIWRFVFSEGVVDENAWAGIVLPSVDRVGRYFPFTIVRKMPGSTSPSAFMALNSNWYRAIENAALEALEGQLDLESLVERINAEATVNHRYVHQTSQANNENIVIDTPILESGENDFLIALPNLTDIFLKQDMKSYGVWSTCGSEYVSACAFIQRSFPGGSGIAAMMDGQWHDWGWKQPFQLV